MSWGLAIVVRRSDQPLLESRRREWIARRDIILSRPPQGRRFVLAARQAAGTQESSIKFLRMKPGHGEVLLAEGDRRVREEEDRLVAEFRRQLDEGMWAAVPVTEPGSGRREARMIKQYAEIPADAERVIFFPRAAGG